MSQNTDVPSPSSRPCPECMRSLPRTREFFHVDPSCADFLRRVCRDCINEQRRARYRANPEPIRERERQRRATRTELMKASPQWTPTDHRQATDLHGPVAFLMTSER